MNIFLSFFILIFATTIVIPVMIPSVDNYLHNGVNSFDLFNLENGTILREPCTDEEGAGLVGLHTVEILQAQGYDTETHYVTTDDGYIFEVHRIPAPGKPVVYVLPGIFQSSRDLVLNCKGRSLASKLTIAGYDVWLGNFRGTTYGRNHTSFSPDNGRFWKYSIDQLYVYDGPAALNYILNATGQAQLNWVGFSLGNNVLIGMLSTYPEYSDKIKFGAAMGPAVYFNHTRTSLLRLWSPMSNLFESIGFTMMNGVILPPMMSNYFRQLFTTLCSEIVRSYFPQICTAAFDMIDGKDGPQENLAYYSAILSLFPSPTSARVVTHWLQLIASGNFQKFDYGMGGNLYNYGSVKPPLYNLTNVKVPLLLLWGENDALTTKEDVLRATKEMPNVIRSIRIEWKKWNHLDFLYGKDSDILVYDHILRYLAKYNP